MSGLEEAPYKMLQDAKTIRYYQRITDALVDQWNRGYRSDDLRRYIAGYLAALRHSDALCGGAELHAF